MKKYVGEFLRRGFFASGFGPLILVVFYLVLQNQADVKMLTVREVCIGIVSLYSLAFVAGGMNMVYQIEWLPLAWAILLHGCVLYISYLAVYLVNGWLQSGLAPILVFTVIYILGYIAVWVVIYSVTRKNTEKINAMLKQKQEKEESTSA